MIYTEEVFAIEEQLNQLTRKIAASHSLEKLVASKIAIQGSQEVQQKIKNFTEARESFERIEAYGSHAPDFTVKRRAMRQEKRQLDTDPAIVDYRVHERDFQETLDTITYRLAQVVSTDIKIDAGNPFFEFAQRGCGGSCHIG